MNAIVNQTRLSYCCICDETIYFKNEVKHLNSKSDKHKKK